jgi:hypothetical protein
MVFLVLRPLRPLLTLVHGRHMVTDGTAAERAEHGVMPGIVTRDTADDGTLYTAFCLSLQRCARADAESADNERRQQ